MEVLTCLEIHGQFKATQGSDRENQNPSSTLIPNLAPEWLSALVPKGQAPWIIYSLEVQEKKHRKLDFPLQSRRKMLFEKEIWTYEVPWRDSSEAKAEDILEHQPAPSPCPCQRQIPDRSGAISSAHSALRCWQQRGKGKYRQAGLETLLWPHLNFRCPRESF